MESHCFFQLHLKMCLCKMECSLAVKVNLNYTRNVEMSFFVFFEGKTFGENLFRINNSLWEWK